MTQPDPTPREKLYTAISEILADSGESLTGFVLLCEWDNGAGPRYLSKSTGDPIGRPLSGHEQGVMMNVGLTCDWPEESVA